MTRFSFLRLACAMAFLTLLATAALAQLPAPVKQLSQEYAEGVRQHSPGSPRTRRTPGRCFVLAEPIIFHRIIEHRSVSVGFVAVTEFEMAQSQKSRVQRIGK